MKRSYNIKRTSFVCVALLLVALPGVAEKKREARGISQCCRRLLNVVGDYFNDYKEEKIVNEKYPEVLQRLKNNLKTFK